MRAFRQADQQAGLMAKGAVFPADAAAVQGQMFRAQHLEGDGMTAAPVQGIHDARIMPQGKGVVKIIDPVNFVENLDHSVTKYIPASAELE